MLLITVFVFNSFNFGLQKVRASLVLLWSNGLVFKALDHQSGGPGFKSTGWPQGRLSLSSL